MNNLAEKSELIAKTFINARIDFVTTFLEEMEVEQYQTMAQVRGSLYIQLDLLEQAKKAHEEQDLRSKLEKYHGPNVDCAFRGWNDVWLHPDFVNWNIEEVLPNIRVPLLVIQGEDDEYGTRAQVESIAFLERLSRSSSIDFYRR